MTRLGTRGGEQIEFLAPRELAFGSEDPVDFVGLDVADLPEGDDAEPRPRWLAAAAGVAIVAILGVGVAAAAPWDAPDAQSAPTTLPSHAPTTVPSSGPVSTAPLGYVLDPPPAGLELVGAWTNDSTPRRGIGWGEVWTTADASGSTGAWFSVTLSDALVGYGSGDATEVDLGSHTGLLWTREDGTSALIAPVSQTHGSRSLQLVSYGMTADRQIALFSSIGIDDDRPQLIDDRPVYREPALIDGFSLLVGRRTEADLLDAWRWPSDISDTTYAASNGADAARWVRIAVSPRDDELDVLTRLLIGPVRLFPDSASLPAGFDEHVVLGLSPSGDDPAVTARWNDVAVTVTVTSNLPLGELLELLPFVRPAATAEEWSSVQRDAIAAQAERLTESGIVIDDGEHLPVASPGAHT